ncbi:CHAP domain-containing protein [Hyunsoonleella ulvae]|uniref:CHAP domain-containing protein n=1 Tax=Hyunsoonleella ulvae TaxID=2799948 RepID=UPI00293D354F|nr:CHAP domain-containing protein [Hyunsoonleella ulvae]
MKLVVVFFAIFLVLSCKNNNRPTVHRNEIVIKKEIKHPLYRVINPGDTLDVFNGVYVFYNESMNNTYGRHLTKDGYNLGLKWQCVEFVKRYYFEYLNHKMPNSYGHAKDFFNTNIKDGKLNRDRNLQQFKNGSKQKPRVNDIIVFKGNMFNPYGHVAIISKVTDVDIEIIQQNVGKTSRASIDLEFKNNAWLVDDTSVLGWLGIKTSL